MILLAEDNEVSALVFLAFLEEWGCIVTRVTNGYWAIQEAGHRLFDMILIDIHMPGISGNDAIRKIRELDRQVPMIGVTTSSMKDESTARTAGADHIISKPVNGYEPQKILTPYF